MTHRIVRVTQGQAVSAARANAVADRIHELDDVLTPHFGDVPDTEAEGQLFTITDISGTELLAIAGTNAPAVGDSIFTVRLAPELVEASRDGVTITVIDVNNATATDGTTNETWSMIKPFAIGDIVEAFQWESDGVFVDRNIAGRMWAADPVIGGGGGAST